MSITHCPEHPELELEPSVERHVAVQCPKDGRRFCLSCGAFAMGAWSSGRCDSCYRIESRQHEARQRDYHDQSVARQALLDAADALDADLNSEIIQWLRVRAEGVAA